MVSLAAAAEKRWDTRFITTESTWLLIGVAVNIMERVQRWRLLVITRRLKKQAPGDSSSKP